MRRGSLVAAASVFAGTLAGCGLIIDVSETYAGPASAADATAAAAGDDSPTTTPIPDAGSVAVTAQPVAFPCDAGAWSLDCTFGVGGSVVLSDQALSPALLAVPQGGHLYAAVPLDDTGATAVVAVETSGADARQLAYFTSGPLRDLTANETVATAAETRAYVYTLTDTASGTASLRGVFWDTVPAGDTVSASGPQSLGETVGSAVAIASSVSFFVDTIVTTRGTANGPRALNVALQNQGAAQVFTVADDYDLVPLASCQATTPAVNVGTFWSAGTSLKTGVVADLLFDGDQYTASVETPFVVTEVAALDDGSIVALGPAASADAGGDAGALPFVVGSIFRVADGGSASTDITAAASGSLTLPAMMPPGALRVIARRTGTGPTPASMLTVAAVSPAAVNGHDALVLLRYTLTPDQALDVDAAVQTPDGMQATGTATAALDPTFGGAGVVVLPLGYDDVQLGALRASADDDGYYLSLRVTLAGGAEPAVLVHVRGDGT